MINTINEDELERLSVLLEEMGEVSQIIGKIQRFGYESCNPIIHPSPTNRELLVKEVGDVIVAISMLIDNSDIDKNELDERIYHKSCNINTYLQHNNATIYNSITFN